MTVAEVAKAHQPAFEMRFSGDNPLRGPVAELTEGEFDLVPMMRALTPEELTRVRARLGFEPAQFVLARHALTVLVHRDNPIEVVTLAQLRAAFAAGERSPTWGELGVLGTWREEPVQAFGRGAATLSYAMFRLHLRASDLRADLVELPSDHAVLREVAASPRAIGFSSAVPANGAVRVLAVSDASPLTMPLRIYIPQRAGKAPAPAVAAFLRFALSSAGQAALAGAGFLPISTADAERQLARL